MTAVPSFKWAEDKDKVYLTIELGDVKDAKIDFDKQSVKFTGTAHSQSYALDLQLKKAIDPSKSSWAAKDRQVEILLAKETPSKDFWLHLLADKNAYKSKIKVDWEHFHDPDEEDFKPQFGNDFGMGGMGGMGMGGMGMGGMGMPGMGGMDFGGMGGMGGFGGDDGGGDSDDEDLPGLENAKDDDVEEEVEAEAGKSEKSEDAAKPADEAKASEMSS